MCGHGNVALDVARMLLTPIDMLKVCATVCVCVCACACDFVASPQTTDICQHALDALAESNIRRVNLIGRRGPLQIAFTIKELREMTRLPGCRSTFDPTDFIPIKDTLNGRVSTDPFMIS